MKKFQRIRNILAGLFIILFSISIMIDVNDGLAFMLIVIGVAFCFEGIRKLVFYFRLARYMVGGGMQLITGIILFDLGAFALSLSQLPAVYAGTYLLFLYMISGLISVMRALEAKRYRAKSWKTKLISGIIDILLGFMALAAGTFLHSPQLVTLIFCIGLAYSGVTRIVSAFRRTAVIYIQ